MSRESAPPRRRTLNSIYITVGTTLILALVAALVAPMFIDWSAYRTTFEEYAGEALGRRVTVLGSTDARLLPTPTLTFSDVRVGPGGRSANGHFALQGASGTAASPDRQDPGLEHGAGPAGAERLAGRIRPYRLADGACAGFRLRHQSRRRAA
ncbi:AsmA family protein [Breoghania sp.]|uniref:AsmA family protein n=1 Tax=Breoghania sp. TaxID=2065378 RepID=UPI002609E0F4|nr:AsmA family protein [Breoghania sp.]MDJ0931176.1 AsmA family protein [Breoghania sp.]